MAAVQESGGALHHASDGLHADKEVAMEAFQQDGYALQYASNDLRADKEIGGHGGDQSKRRHPKVCVRTSARGFRLNLRFYVLRLLLRCMFTILHFDFVVNPWWRN